MSRCHRVAAWSLGALCLLGTGSALADSCTDLAPPALRTQLESHFPGFTFPREYDNAPASVGATRDRGRSSCLGAVSDDFDGDDKDDLVVALTALDGEGALIVAIRDAMERPAIATLDQQRRGRRTLSLSVGGPGVYERARFGRGTLRPLLAADEVERLDCPNAVVIVGNAASSARAYCSGRGGWQWVQIGN